MIDIFWCCEDLAGSHGALRGGKWNDVAVDAGSACPGQKCIVRLRRKYGMYDKNCASLV